MKKFLLAILFLFVGPLAIAQGEVDSDNPFFTSPNATEAWMEFSHFVDMSSANAPTEVEARNLIDRQLTYLFGSMAIQTQIAAPKAEHKVAVQEVVKVEAGLFRITYAYRGKIVLEKENRTTDTYRIALPTRPDSIFMASQPSLRGNPCGDSEHNEEEYFWYFWKPGAFGCPLKAGKDFEYIQAKVTRIENTKETYPEYARMVNDKGEINIHMLFGMDDPGKSHNPLNSDDLTAQAYREVRSSLSAQGFSAKAWSESEISKVVPGQLWTTPFVETLSKKTSKGLVQVRMFFDSSAYSSDRAFAGFLKSALESSSMMIYSGHSGLGAYLDLEALEQTHRMQLNPGPQYQIYFFNSCSSYPYYNNSYLARKNTKDLDIVTNGMATYFHTIGSSNRALLNAVINWAEGKRVTSYQTLTTSMDSGNLLGVNGDEDNPTKP